MTSVFALVVGLVVGRLFFTPRSTSEKTESENKELKEQKNQLQNDNMELREQRGRLQTEKESLQESLKKIENEKRDLKEERDNLTSQNRSLTEEKHKQENINIQLTEENKSLKSRESEVKEHVKLYARELLETTASDFKKTQNETMEDIVSPLKEKLEKFQEKIESQEKDRIEQTTDLKKELEKVFEFSEKLSDNAENLTKALKGDQKAQGNWGEMILRKVLESSGLREGEEFVEQSAQKDEEGNMQRPDFLIQLPDKKHLIIDSKVSLVAYEKFINAENEQDQSSFLKEHISSIKRHIEDLAKKHYHSSDDVNSPEFVFLFMGSEPALIVASKEDKGLFAYAWEKKIILVSPSLLLSSLKCAASVWNHERQNKNTQTIAKEAGKLYDKFVGFLESLEGIGRNIDEAKASYVKATERLSTGGGNLIGKVKKIKKLGIQTKKEIGSQWNTEDSLDETLNKSDKKELKQGNGGEKLLEDSLNNKRHESIPKDKNKIANLTHIHSE